MTLPVVFTANGPSGYNLTKSLRFRESASANLSRTPASAGNLQIMTFSFWVKRGLLGAATNEQGLISSSDNTLHFGPNSYSVPNGLVFRKWDGAGANTWIIQTTQVFRDPAAWYHIVVV